MYTSYVFICTFLPSYTQMYNTILSAILSAFTFSPLFFSVYNSQCAQVHAIHPLSLSFKPLALANAVFPPLPSGLLWQEFLEHF